MHGTSRLMGNLLLDVVVFGRRAGAAAVEAIHDVETGPLTVAHPVARYHSSFLPGA